jgi:hypothetical protein
LLDAWTDQKFINGDRQPPLIDAANTALSNMTALKADVRRYAPNGQRKRYWLLNPDMVLDFAERNQIGDTTAMRAMIDGPLIKAGDARPFGVPGLTAVAN